MFVSKADISDRGGVSPAPRKSVSNLGMTSIFCFGHSDDSRSWTGTLPRSAFLAPQGTLAFLRYADSDGTATRPQRPGSLVTSVLVRLTLKSSVGIGASACRGSRKQANAERIRGHFAVRKRQRFSEHYPAVIRVWPRYRACVHLKPSLMVEPKVGLHDLSHSERSAYDFPSTSHVQHLSVLAAARFLLR